MMTVSTLQRRRLQQEYPIRTWKSIWIVMIGWCFVVDPSATAFSSVSTHVNFPRQTARFVGCGRKLLASTKSSSPRRCTIRHMSQVYSTTESENNNNNQESYSWTGPTLDIALPALIGMMTDPLLSLMDTAFVGRVGSTELAALGACTSIFHLAFNAFRATTTATTSLVATSLGQDENHSNSTSFIPEPNPEARQVTQISLALGLKLGLLVFLFLRVLAGPWCLHCMGVDHSQPKLFDAAWVYLRTRSWAAPFVLWVVVAEGAFRGYGDTKIPLVASMVAAVMNLILDPLFMFGFGWQVMGAAAATATAQVGAAIVYAVFLWKRKMLKEQTWKLWKRNKTASPQKTTTATANWKTRFSFSKDTWRVVKTIVNANLAMMAKQGSLLLAWAYATARATRLGTHHVAAHQVGLSFWLVFALWLDGAAVSAQVLMSRATTNKKKRSLSWFMAKLATAQGLASTALIYALGTTMVPHVFTKNAMVRMHLKNLMPHLAWQQLLISWTLVTEGLAVGGNEFATLAIGTCISTVLSMIKLREATSVEAIWSRGIVTLFVGRLVTALIGAARVNGVFQKNKERQAVEPVT